MRIICIYGVKTSDYNWLEGFYPCRRLREAFAARNIQTEFLLPEDAHNVIRKLTKKSRDRNPDEKPGGTAFLLRGTIPDSLLSLLACAQEAGLPCFNSPRAFRTAGDKLLCAELCAGNGIPVPRTVPAETGADSGITLSRETGFPCVIKPRFGSRGRGIFLAESAEKAEEFLAGQRRAEEEPYIRQEYIAFSRGRDLRLFFAGEKILCMAERRNAGARDGLAASGGNPEIRSNVTCGGVFFPPDRERKEPLLHSAAGILKKLRAATGLFYGAADFLFKSETELVLCEVNASPGFEGIERQMKTDIAGRLAEAIAEESSRLSGTGTP